jgi:hypothetical protein
MAHMEHRIRHPKQVSVHNLRSSFTRQAQTNHDDRRTRSVIRTRRPPAAGCWRGWPRLALRHCLPHHPASAGQATEWSMPLTAAAAAWVLLLPCGLAAAAGVRAAPRAAAAAASGSPKPPNFIFVLADDWVCAPHWSVSRNAGTTQSHAACRAGVTSASTWRAAQGSSGIRRHTRRSWTEWLRRVSSSPTFTPHHPSVRRPEWGS